MSPTIVIFGASGDLTSRKLVPALYELHRKRRLPQGTRIVGFSRTPMSHVDWRERLAAAAESFLPGEFDRGAWDAFAPCVTYHPGDIAHPADFAKLRSFLEELEDHQPTTRIYYLSTAPQFYEPAILQLGASGLAAKTPDRRVVVEKPFGINRQTARQLNEVLQSVFSERQVYRIDHYLGKETVQNVLVLRFANTIFEPVWNRNYVNHVEITAAEELTIGHRAGYYDTAGVLRDMFQNHLLQLLALTAMEAPARFEADSIRDEKVKVLRSIRPMRAEDVAARTVRGQYRGYLDEPNVAAESRTATFAAVRIDVENWRWQGVPFFLRSGKAMSCPTTQIVIQFRQPPHLLFESGSRGLHESNCLVIQIQPAEGVQVHFQTKVPDAGMQLRLTDLNFRFRDKFNAAMPDAYQRLLLDVMLGDASLFARSDEVELAWGIIDPIQQAWDEQQSPELRTYQPGDWGPAESIKWIARAGHDWFDACPALH